MAAPRGALRLPAPVLPAILALLLLLVFGCVDAQEAVRLSQNSTAQSDDTNTVRVQLSTDDLNQLKQRPNFFENENNSFVAVEWIFGTDLTGNPVASSDFVPVSTFQRDSGGPVLLAFGAQFLRNNSLLLQLTFDEPVIPGSLEAANVVLGNASSNLTLSPGYVISTPSASPVLTLYLNESDVDSIKLLPNLWTQKSNTQLQLLAAALSDAAGNPNGPSPRLTAIAYGADVIVPHAVSFGLDLDAAELTVVFHELVDPAAVVIASFQLFAPDGSASVTLSDSSVTELVVATRTLVLSLGAEDLFNVLNLSTLAVDASSTALRLMTGAVSDYAGNTALETNLSDPSPFVPDSIAPLVSHSVLDLESLSLTLTFSEPINATSWQETLMTLRGVGALQPGDTTGAFIAPAILELTLTPSLANAIKNSGLLTNASTSNLALATSFVLDKQGNPLADTNLTVSTYVADASGPRLVQADLNLTSRELYLTFDETVDAATLNASAITLGAPGLGQQLRDSSPVRIAAAVVRVDLADDDFNAVVAGLLVPDVDLANATVSLSVHFAEDVAGNANEGTTLTVTEFSPDGASPTVVSIDLNMDAGILSIQWSETIDVSSLDLTSITVGLYDEVGTGVELQATESTSNGLTAIAINLTTGSLNAIKERWNIATGLGNTFFQVMAGLIDDASGNANAASANVPVSTFTADATSPTLSAFALDLNSGLLTLIFDETVQASTINSTAIMLLNGPNAAPDTNTDAYSLSAASLPTVLDANSTTITISLAQADVNAINARDALAYDAASTYLAIQSSLVLDMVGLPVQAIPATNPLAIAAYTADTTPPTLVSFALNLTAGTLDLVFDETMNLTSINPAALALVVPGQARSSGHALTGGVLTAPTPVSINILLDEDDLKAIKLKTDLALDAATTALDLAAAAAADAAGNPTVAARYNLTDVGSAYEPDSIAPVLLSLVVDLNRTQLILNFDEPILSASLNISALAASENALGDVSLVRLTNGSTTSPNGQQLIIQLTKADVDSIKLITSLWTNVDNTWLQLASSAVQDMAGNANAPAALNATAFIADHTRPYLLTWSLDMDAGSMLLSFSESINQTSLDPTLITLQTASNVAGATFHHVLTDGLLDLGGLQGDQIRLIFAVEDLHTLKLKGIGHDNTTAWLVAADGYALDMNGQPAVALTNGLTALVADSVALDVTAPSLSSATLDMDTLQLLLAFDEPVDVSTLDVDAITVQDAADGAGSAYTLTAASGTASASADGLVVAIAISDQDANAIKAAASLAVNALSSFLSIATSAVSDVAGNAVALIPTTAALPVSTYIADGTAPTLGAFDFNMTATPTTLTLRFSETVNVNTLNLSALTLRAAADSVASAHQLTGGVIRNDNVNASVIVVELLAADANAIKAVLDLAVSQATTFISAATGLVVDTSGNEFVALPATSAIPVTDFYADVEPPTVAAFSLDMELGVLLVTFSETMDASTLAGATFALQNQSSGCATEAYIQLSSSPSPATPSTLFNFTLSASNLNALRSSPPLFARAANETFLVVLDASAADMAGVTMTNDTICAPLVATEVVLDATSPKLLGFSIDMSSRTMRMTFSEFVSLPSLDAVNLALGPLPSAIALAFSDARLESQATIIANLTESVWARLAQASDVCYNASSCTLTGQDFVQDGYQNSVEAVADLVPSLFTADAVRPELIGFALDFEQSSLLLNFSEPLDMTTFTATEFALGNTSRSVPLNGSVSAYSSTFYSVRLMLTAVVRDTLMQSEICTSAGECFIAATAAAVTDAALNPLTPLAMSEGLSASSVVVDTTRPYFTQFLSYDIGHGFIVLEFSEPIDPRAFDPTGLQLHDSCCNSLLTYTLTGFSSISTTLYTINITLSDTDLNNIKAEGDLCSRTTGNDCFVRMTAAAFADYVGNQVQAVPTSTNIAQSYPYTVYPDVQGAFVVAASLELDARRLNMTFNEPIDPQTIVGSQLFISDGVQDTMLSSATTTATELAMSVSLGLSTADINTLKATNTSLFMSTEPAAVLGAGFVEDASGNGNDAQTYDDLIVVEDALPPTLARFSYYNANDNYFYLSFTEPVQPASLNFSAIVLHSSSNTSASTSYRLTAGMASHVAGTSNTTLRVDLDEDDVVVLKVTANLVKSSSATLVALDESAVRDFTGNPSSATSGPVALVGTYVADQSAPVLQQYALDMNSGQLFLTFSDVMDPASLSVLGHLGIQSKSNERDINVQRHEISSATTTSQAGFRIVLTLSASDILAIKNLTGLATSRATTFLSMSAELIADVVGTSALSVLTTNALQATNVTSDNVPPQLSTSRLVMDSNTLTFTFNEPILPASIDLSQISVAATSTASTLNISLSGLNWELLSFKRELSIEVSDAVADFLKVTDNTGAYSLYLATGAVSDAQGNPIDFLDWTMLTTVLPDTVAPIVQQFSIDFNVGLVNITFSEPVNVTSLSENGVGLSVDNPSSVVQVTVVDAAVIEPRSLSLMLNASSLDALKLAFTGSNPINTRLHMTAGSVQDMYGHGVDANNMPLLAALVVLDTTPIALEAIGLDMDTAQLTLTFSEPALTSSFNWTFGITLSHPNASDVVVNSGSIISPNGRTIVVALTDATMDTLKLSAWIGFDLSTNVSLPAQVVSDMAGNLLQNSVALSVSTLLADVTSPELVALTFDEDAGSISLTFNEPVRVNTLISNASVLQGDAILTSATESARLSDAVPTVGSVNGRFVTLLVSTGTLNEIKSQSFLAVDVATTFFNASSDFVMDMFDNPLLATSPAVQAASVTRDSVAPTLSGITLDLNASVLVLTFSEFVELNSVNLTRLRIGDDALQSNMTFETSTVTRSSLVAISVLISTADLNRLKILTYSTSAVDYVVSVRSAFVADSAANPIATANHIAVDSVVADATAPEVTSWDVDASDEVIVRFYFNEPMNINSLDLGQVAWNGITDLEGSAEVDTTLSVITVNISTAQANELKANGDLTAGAVVPLTWTSAFVADVAGNNVQAENNSMASTFTADATSPTLSAFALDLNSGLLTLIFDETVQASTINSTAIMLLNGPNAAPDTNTDAYSLSAASLPTVLDTNSTTITISLAQADVNAINARDALAYDAASTYLAIQSSLVLDMVGLPVQAIPATNPLAIAAYTADTTPPTLVSFALNLTAGTLDLVFDETMNLTSINPAALALVVPGQARSSGHALTGGVLTAPTPVSINILLDEDDLKAIKLKTDLALDAATTALDLAAAAAADAAGNPTVAARYNLTDVGSAYEPDSIAPVLLSLVVDLNRTQLILNFDEPILSASLNISALAASENALGDVSLVRLTNGSTTSPNGQQLIIQLTKADVDSIKLITSLWTNVDNTWLQLASSAVQDMAGNANAPAALNATAFIADHTRPYLLTWSLDMDAGSMLLSFSESINQTSLDPTLITLQTASNVAGATFHHVLTDGLLDLGGLQGDQIRLIFAVEDLHTLKLKGIGHDNTTAWLVAADGYALDMNGQPAVALTNGLTALVADSVALDVTAPSLSSATLDMDTLQLLLAFDEPVDVSTLDVDAITVQDAADGAGSAYTLTAASGTASASADGLVVAIAISDQDANAIKAAASLAVNALSSFLSIATSAVSDVAGNAVALIPTTAALPVSTYIADGTAPTLGAFDFNMTATPTTLTLRFSETVNVNTLNLSALTLRAAADSVASAHQLTGGVIRNDNVNASVIVVELLAADANAIKAVLDLAVSQATTFISAATGLVVDTSGNEFVALPATSAIPVTDFYADVEPPTVAAFSLDMELGVLLVTFSETMDASTLAGATFALQNQSSGCATVDSSTVTVSTYAAISYVSFNITIDATELESLQALRTVGKWVNATFLTFASGTIDDTSGNSLASVADCASIPVATLTLDPAGPTLSAASIDLGTSTLDLTFSEYVVPSILNALSLSTEPSASFLAVTDQLTVALSGSHIRVQLDPVSLQPLKERVPTLGAGAANAFLQVSPATFEDGFGNPIGLTTVSLTVSGADTTPPVLEYFSLDLTSENVTLRFSDIIDPTTVDPSAVLISGTGGVLIQLTNTTVVSMSAPSASVVLALSGDDLAALKLNPNVAVSTATSRLGLQASFCADVYGNPNAQVDLLSGRVPDLFVGDTLPPVLESFTFDLDGGVITLTFDEPVSTDPSLWHADRISLQDGETAYRENDVMINGFNLTAGSTASSDGRVVSVALTLADLNRIKALRGLCSRVDNCFATLKAGAFADMGGIPSDAVEDGQAIYGGIFVEDTTRPSLTSFDMEMTADGTGLTLTMYFDETMDASTLDITKLVLQDAPSTPSETVSLTGFDGIEAWQTP